MPDDDFDLEAIIGDSNGGAYRKDEIRTGPPLDYVAEKARHALTSLHSVVQFIDEHVPDDLPQPSRARGALFSSKGDGLAAPAQTAFYYALVSYLALNNMLHLANDRLLPGSLTAMSYEEFDRWLDVIDREGSVTG